MKKFSDSKRNYNRGESSFFRFLWLHFIFIEEQFPGSFKNGGFVVPRVERLLDGPDLLLLFVENLLLNNRVERDELKLVCQPAAPLVVPLMSDKSIGGFWELVFEQKLLIDEIKMDGCDSV